MEINFLFMIQNIIKPEIFMKANNSEKDPKKYADE